MFHCSMATRQIHLRPWKRMAMMPILHSMAGCIIAQPADNTPKNGFFPEFRTGPGTEL
jgi:hypothetical protein